MMVGCLAQLASWVQMALGPYEVLGAVLLACPAEVWCVGGTGTCAGTYWKGLILSCDIGRSLVILSWTQVVTCLLYLEMDFVWHP